MSVGGVDPGGRKFTTHKATESGNLDNRTVTSGGEEIKVKPHDKNLYESGRSMGEHKAVNLSRGQKISAFFTSLLAKIARVLGWGQKPEANLPSMVDETVVESAPLPNVHMANALSVATSEIHHRIAALAEEAQVTLSGNTPAEQRDSLIRGLEEKITQHREEKLNPAVERYNKARNEGSPSLSNAIAEKEASANELMRLGSLQGQAKNLHLEFEDAIESATRELISSILIDSPTTSDAEIAEAVKNVIRDEGGPELRDTWLTRLIAETKVG